MRLGRRGPFGGLVTGRRCRMGKRRPHASSNNRRFRVSLSRRFIRRWCLGGRWVLGHDSIGQCSFENCIRIGGNTRIIANRNDRRGAVARRWNGGSTNGRETRVAGARLQFGAATPAPIYGTQEFLATIRALDGHFIGSARSRLFDSRSQNEFAQFLIFADFLQPFGHIGSIDFDFAHVHVRRFETEFLQ